MRKSITENEFAEFYVLNALSPLLKDRGDNNLLQYRDRLVHDIVEFYLKHIQIACVAEAMHNEYRRWPNRKGQLNDREQLRSMGIDKHFIITEEYLYAGKNKFESAKRLIIVFRHMLWEPAYGGSAWADIAELYKELLECQNEIRGIGRQYVTRVIRDHIDGKINNKIIHMMDIIDRIHQVEHNTGSIFTKFPNNMCKWLETSLNEKATSCSIQLLRDYCNKDIVAAAKLLDIKDKSSDIVEHELGEVILSRSEYKSKKTHEATLAGNLHQLDEDLYTKYITEEQYEQKKAIYLAEFNEKKSDMLAAPSFFSTILSSHYGRNQRGILRAIIARNNDTLYANENMLLYYIRDGLLADKKMFDIAAGEPRLHRQIAETIVPYISNVKGSHKKEIYDLIYKVYPDLVPGRYLKTHSINAAYDFLASMNYDMSKYEKFAKETTQNLKNECSCVECKPYQFTADADAYTAKYNVYLAKFLEPTANVYVKDTGKPNTAKTFAIKYAGKLIQKIAGKLADKRLIAGKIVGYKPAVDGEVGAIIWVPTIEYSKKYATYTSVEMPADAVITYQHYDKSQGVHFTQFGYIDVASLEVINKNINHIDWFQENKKIKIPDTIEDAKKATSVQLTLPNSIDASHVSPDITNEQKKIRPLDSLDWKPWLPASSPAGYVISGEKRWNRFLGKWQQHKEDVIKSAVSS